MVGIRVGDKQMMKRTKLLLGLSGAYAILAFVLFLSHTYNDIVITTRHGINFWNILLNGRILDFYSLNVAVSGNPNFPVEQGCAYNIVVYLVFAVWNFPLFLAEHYLDVDVMNHFLCLVYSKLLLIVAVIATVWVLKKILFLLGVRTNKLWGYIYIYLTSTVMLSVTLITSQYDVIALFFILLGVKAYLERNNPAFILWFGVALCFKYFALVVFLPLLVLRWKTIKDWVRYLFFLILPVLFTTLPFRKVSLFNEASLEFSLFNMLLRDNAFNINLFVMVYVFLIVWCYLQDSCQDDEQMRHISVWSCFVAFSAFFGLLNAYPYWSILLMPFVTMVMVYVQHRMYLCLLLETFAMSIHVLENMIDYNWCYFGNTMKSMMMSLFLDLVPDCSGPILATISALENENTLAILNTVFVASLIALAWLSFFGKNPKDIAPEENYSDILIVRFGISAVVCLMPLLSLFA